MMSITQNKLNLQPEDTIIALMGPSGSGKSQFIKTATKQIDIGVGHSLQSQTSEVQTVRCTHPHDPKRSIVFVDTPSFNNTDLPDSVVLKMIADWLQKTYKHSIKLSGIIYTHRITDNRMAGSPLRNLRLFENLCGEDSVQNVVLATTMWSDRMKREVGDNRERELVEKYWKSMIEHGSRTRRYMGSHESAWKIVDELLRRSRPRSLLLQQELVDEGKPLPKTRAGMTLQDVQWMISDYREVEGWGAPPLLKIRRMIFT